MSASGVSAIDRIRAAEFRNGGDEQRAALAHIFGNVVVIEDRQNAAVLVAVEDDQVKFLDLVDEEFARREGDQREFVDRCAILLFGGRRMVKWTRSTSASDFNRFRQARSPACGSPETSRTRRFWRIPSSAGTARLLLVVSSPGDGGDFEIYDIGPGAVQLEIEARGPCRVRPSARSHLFTVDADRYIRRRADRLAVIYDAERHNPVAH